MSDYNVEVYRAERGNCPVCGALGGNCAGDSEYSGGINILPRKKKDPRATFRVPERIYEETMVGTRKVKKLLYAKGDAVTPAEAKRLGLIPSDSKPTMGKPRKS